MVGFMIGFVIGLLSGVTLTCCVAAKNRRQLNEH